MATFHSRKKQDKAGQDRWVSPADHHGYAAMRRAGLADGVKVFQDSA